MVSLTRSKENKASNAVVNGMRPVNLKTDLAALADLIELAFADSMDGSGRAALREMRYLSKLGPGLPILSRLNDTTLGINLGYVWIVGDQLVGNVSVYPTSQPGPFKDQWIIANVAVHPSYQGRGIARRLMQASMEMIRQKRGTAAILQVDVNNTVARHLYRKLDFVEDRTWTTWRRSSYSSSPEPAFQGGVHITRRRHTEWREELALAQRLRPQKHGGIGWLRPLHDTQFKKSPLASFMDWINLRSTERLVIRDEQERIGGALWIENTFGSPTRLTLMVDPRYHGFYDEALISTAVRRFGRGPIAIEHPADQETTSTLLERYRFTRQRTLVHMRHEIK